MPRDASPDSNVVQAFVADARVEMLFLGSPADDLDRDAASGDEGSGIDEDVDVRRHAEIARVNSRQTIGAFALGPRRGRLFGGVAGQHEARIIDAARCNLRDGRGRDGDYEIGPRI